MRITTKIVWDSEGNIIEHKYYDYSGPIAYCGGPTGGEKAIAADEGSFFRELMDHYKTIFGDMSKIYGDLTATFEPIVKAGPEQEGMTPTEYNTRSAQIKQQTGLATTHAEQAAADRFAAQGGIVPSGARESILSKIQTEGAVEGSREQAALTAEDYAVGRQNWLNATKGILGAPSVFTPAIESGRSATAAGEGAFGAEAKMAEQQGSWLGAVGGILGKVAQGATMSAMR